MTVPFNPTQARQVSQSSDRLVLLLSHGGHVPLDPRERREHELGRVRARKCSQEPPREV